MGSWGYGPFDSDAAEEWYDYFLHAKTPQEVIGLIQDALNVKQNKHCAGYAEAYAAADMVWRYGMKPLVTAAIVALDIIEHDDKWVSSWKKPRKFTDEVDKLVNRLTSDQGIRTYWNNGYFDCARFGRTLRKRIDHRRSKVRRTWAKRPMLGRMKRPPKEA